MIGVLSLQYTVQCGTQLLIHGKNTSLPVNQHIIKVKIHLTTRVISEDIKYNSLRKMATELHVCLLACVCIALY